MYLLNTACSILNSLQWPFCTWIHVSWNVKDIFYMLIVLHYYFSYFWTKRSWHTEEKTSRSITKNRFSKHNRVNLFSFKITASVVAIYFYFPITQVFGSTLINMQVRSCCGNSSYFTTFRWIHLHNRGTRTPSPA